MRMHLSLISALILLMVLCTATIATPLEVISRNPYSGAIVVDAATGRVLFEDNADARGYPASITKLMVLLVILDAVDANRLTLSEPVTVTAKAARIGGSQVYLKENEVFPVDELLYALIVQSANDAATALAIHYAGNKEAFVELMNRRAQEIGMRDTIFRSVHGLPPGKGQLPDISTPRDIAKLCREILKKPGALKYTSTKLRSFRTGTAEPFFMKNHNRLLGRIEGCDGLKTGYFRAAGFSIAATATKKNKRAIAVVFGATNQRVRDAKAKEILVKGLTSLVMSASPPVPSPASGARTR
jgi:D-alanyl-D-alanine carboxypeptidase (penicillin-binding protein 5/6)